MTTDQRLLCLTPGDNVVVVRQGLRAGDEVEIEGARVTVPSRLGLGHKLARTRIAKGDRIVKYGAPIGRATEDIPVGAHVHIHNVTSEYTPTYALSDAKEKDT